MANNVRFILASASPRRHDLLNSVGIPHEILVTEADENPAGSPAEGQGYAEYYALSASLAKGLAAAEVAKPTVREGERTFVISADTVVSPDGDGVFGKPRDEEDAASMLRTLSGGEHLVIGGLTVTELRADGDVTVSRSITTRVRFRDLTDGEIASYVASGEVWGKAGAYAIQGLGGAFVSDVAGDYPNVVGISVYGVYDILKGDFGLNLSESFPRVD